MSIWHSKATEGLGGLITRAEVRELWRAWLAEADTGTKTETQGPANGGSKPVGLPDRARFDPAQWPELSQHLMLLRADAGTADGSIDFTYEHYGAGIARVAGFDMTGKRVSEFGGELSVFFAECYREALGLGRPMHSVHYSDRVPTVFSWERLILPLGSASGARWLLVHNEPLEQRHSLLGQVLNATSDAVMALRAQRDARGVRTDWMVMVVNEAMLGLTGRALRSVVGHPVSQALLRWEDLGLAVYCEQALASQLPQHFDTQSQVKAVRRWFEGVVAPLGDGCVIRLVDVTEQRERAQALVERESELQAAHAQLRDAMLAVQAASMAKSAFLATMSHEIRTPMNGVLGMAQLLTQSALPPREQAMARTILESARALTAVVDDVLDFSRIEAGELRLQLRAFRPHDLAQVAVGSLAEWSASLDVEVKLSVLGPSRVVLGDVGRLRQILLQLVRNGVKFSSGRAEEPGEVCLLSDLSQDVWSVEVVDNGIGMDEATQAQLFQPFALDAGASTRRAGGTGFGLAIAARLVKQMQGRIEVESRPGQGSRFRLSLPLSSAENHVDAPAAAPAEARLEPVWHQTAVMASGAGQPAWILVAEDDRINQILIDEQLRRLGYRTEVFDNGRDALLAWQRGGHDLVLTDLNMPEMDGVALCRAVRVHALEHGLAAPPVVLVTANALSDTDQATRETRFDGFLTKPVELSNLSRVLSAMLGRATASQP